MVFGSVVYVERSKVKVTGRGHTVTGRVPGAKMPSPWPSVQPMSCLILVKMTSSMSVNTGAISYVNLTHTHLPAVNHLARDR